MEFSLAASMVSFEIQIYFHQGSKIRPEIIYDNDEKIFFIVNYEKLPPY